MKLIKKIHTLFYQSTPELRKRVFIIGFFLVSFNVFVWIVALIFSQKYPVLLGLITLAYGLGLRHAVDADHIAATDNTTRKLMQDGKKPVGVGFFFSLGHSTVVVLLSLLFAFFTSYTKNVSSLREIGSVIGTSISGIFLLLIGFFNLIIFIDIVKTWRIVSKEKKSTASLDGYIQNKGVIARFFKPIFTSISKSWHMYFVGFLFGLGFDTATEVGILSISAASGGSGMPLFYTMLLPLAFTAGMVLVDTLDGILMLGAYGWAYIHPIRKLYYNMHITFISVVIALCIGSIELLQVLTSQLKLSGGIVHFFHAINFGNVGYAIIAIVIASWVISLGIYRIQKYRL